MMAQRVGYFQDNVEYTEGPFVHCDFVCNGYGRIECEMKDHHCPVLPDSSIYDLLKFEKDYVGGERDRTIELVDWLNEQVSLGRIVLDGRVWVCPEFAKPVS
jgi:hypothetical protein